MWRATRSRREPGARHKHGIAGARWAADLGRSRLLARSGRLKGVPRGDPQGKIARPPIPHRHCKSRCTCSPSENASLSCATRDAESARPQAPPPLAGRGSAVSRSPDPEAACRGIHGAPKDAFEACMHQREVDTSSGRRPAPIIALPQIRRHGSIGAFGEVHGSHAAAPQQFQGLPDAKARAADRGRVARRRARVRSSRASRRFRCAGSRRALQPFRISVSRSSPAGFASAAWKISSTLRNRSNSAVRIVPFRPGAAVGPAMPEKNADCARQCSARLPESPQFQPPCSLGSNAARRCGSYRRRTPPGHSLPIRLLKPPQDL
jgi:hypothetical protein